MPASPSSGAPGPIDRLAELVDTLAGAWAPRAAASTTTGQERAILRLFGVRGLGREQRPLAWEVVERYAGQHPARLAGGIALPFAMALLEYDVSPQQLALDVAAGAIDLGLEAELLRQSDRRAVAEVEALRLADTALERLDANRTARRELTALLGDHPAPWIGTTLPDATGEPAVRAAQGWIRSGIDLLRIEVPAGWELASHYQEGDAAAPGHVVSRDRLVDEAWEPAPAGSQRGLAALRQAIDEAAAERGRYVRLATVAPPLAAPEQAVVAAFERVDVVELDVMAEIVDGGVDPDRALADQAFAGRLLERCGAVVLVGGGPLVVGPDMLAGLPSDEATRAGRALALQLVAVALARAAGLPAERVVVAALPAWSADAPGLTARALAEVVIRRTLLPEHRLAFVEPTAQRDLLPAWPFVTAGVMAAAGETALILRRPGDRQRVVRDARSAAAVAGDLGPSGMSAISLEGPAAEHARRTVAAAVATLELLRDRGWSSLVGERTPRTAAEPSRLGADAVAERTEPFDPFSSGHPADAGR